MVNGAAPCILVIALFVVHHCIGNDASIAENYILDRHCEETINVKQYKYVLE